MSGIHTPCHTSRRALHCGLRHVIEEIADRNIQDLAHIPQARCADAVGPPFIFLHLLEGDVEFGTKLFLAKPKQRPAQPHAFADMQVDGVVIGDPVMAFDWCVVILGLAPWMWVIAVSPS